MKHEESGMVEADVTINGTRLSFAESMALRVAVSSFRMQLNDPSIAIDLGRELAHNYDMRLAEIEKMMFGGS